MDTKKKQYEGVKKAEAVSFFRNRERSMGQIAGLLCISVSTLSEWNQGFDEAMTPIIVPDGRGKRGKVTAAIVRQVIKVAGNLVEAGRRIRIKAFSRKLQKEHKIELSSKTVSEILTANGLYQVQVRRRRPKFYQSLRQRIPNGLISVDGSEFTVWIDGIGYKFNLELAVDVHSFYHSAFSISETETTAEFIKVMDSHRAAWGTPVGFVSDHGTANLSGEALAYLKSHDIEVLPAGPGNPKGNGTAEGAFSEIKKAIGEISLHSSNPKELAKMVLNKIISVYVALRNRLSRLTDSHSPRQSMQEPVTEAQREEHRQRFKRRKRAKGNPEDVVKLDTLDYFIGHYNLEMDERSLKRAQKCIVYYEKEAIEKSEAAFQTAIRRDQGRCNIAYFFGILKNVQQEIDDDKYRNYCRKRYHYQLLLDKEREEQEANNEAFTEEDLVSILQQTVSVSSQFIKDGCIRHAQRILNELKNQYSYMGILKKRILESVSMIDSVNPAQRQEMNHLVEQLFV